MTHPKSCGANLVRQAVILAAGRGSRLGALTADRPKCLVPLHGVSLLDRTIDALRRAGIERIGATTGYLAEQIARPRLTIFHNADWETSGILHSCASAREWLEDGPTLVIYGDIFVSVDGVKRVMATPGDIVVAYDPRGVELWQRRSDDPLSDLENFRIDPDGLIRQIGGKPACLQDVQGQYMGLLRLSARGWSSLKRATSAFAHDRQRWLDMTTPLQRAINDGVPVHGVAVDGPWGEIDTADDLALYESLYSSELLVGMQHEAVRWTA